MIIAQDTTLEPEKPPVTSGPHGGTLQQIAPWQAETVVSDVGIQVYLFNESGTPVSSTGSRGVAAVRVQDGAKRYRYDLMPDDKGVLTARVNLTKVTGRELTIDVQLVGVGGKNASTITYTEVATVPMSKQQLTAAAIAEQKTCPVSGKPLGSMGEPVGVDVLGQTVYVCCAGCTNAVKANPAKYSPRKLSVEVAKLSATDTPLIEKQAKCPVMDEPLGSMGDPVKLMVGGKPLYLCCKGCVKKIEAEPAKYFANVYGQAALTAVLAKKTIGKGTEEVRPGVFTVSEADKLFIAAQKTCPVMDEPLDAMGGPYKVNAAGKAVYICCPGCAKKIVAEPEMYLSRLRSQGVEAPIIE